MIKHVVRYHSEIPKLIHYWKPCHGIRSPEDSKQRGWEKKKDTEKEKEKKKEMDEKIRRWEWGDLTAQVEWINKRLKRKENGRLSQILHSLVGEVDEILGDGKALPEIQFTCKLPLGAAVRWLMDGSPLVGRHSPPFFFSEENYQLSMDLFLLPSKFLFWVQASLSTSI